jgi:hypothetical protein
MSEATTAPPLPANNGADKKLSKRAAKKAAAETDKAEKAWAEAEAQASNNDFKIGHFNGATIARHASPELKEVTDLLRTHDGVDAKLRTPQNGRITGRKAHDTFVQTVNVVTSTAGSLAALGNEEQFIRILKACPDPCLRELAQSYRIERFISNDVLQKVLPAIAARVFARDSEVSTKDLLAAGGTLVWLWCKHNETLKTALKSGFGKDSKAISDALKTIRVSNLPQCREAFRVHGGFLLTEGAYDDEQRMALEETLRQELVSARNGSYTTEQRNSQTPFALVPPRFRNDFILPIERLVTEADNDSAVHVVAMLCAGLMAYGFKKSKKWNDGYQHLSVLLQLAGAGIALSMVAAPAGLAFIVGDAIAHHYMDKKSKSIMDRVNDLRTSIMSSAYNVKMESLINKDFLILFDMAMGGMGFWPVYQTAAK